MQEVQKKFTTRFSHGQIDEPLLRHSTFKIGGPADLFYRLKDTKDLLPLIKFTKEHKIPYLIIGAGSNLFFQDQGFRGLVIKLETSNIETKDQEISVDAGVQVLKLVKYSVDQDLEGLEMWAGLPGTVGGAVRGNAGCHGLEVKDVLKKALILDTDKEELIEVGPEYFQFEYRHSKLKENKDILINATFQLKNREITEDEQKALLEKSRNFRLTKQPFGFTTGSFFKNPLPDKPAGMLIDQSGLKGKVVGDAQVSTVHANFLINLGKASSKDMHKLIDLIKGEVKQKFGIDLKEEVQIIDPNSN